jgi:hypothetical protein
MRPGQGPATRSREGTWHSACRKVHSLPISHVRSCPIHASRKSPRGTPSPQALELGDCRDGEALPARLREDGFKTEYTATAAGKVVLRNFLAGLAEEVSKP